ncbi:hypothetical protein [Laceyella sacchari]|uniref:Uncharacterized protein n=1 Tax=Laceyella sacchari TaxID=37482 RepID=A0ABY5U560_LACSH|nr:hypothetical protein [Laceyella sacchari]TCW41178.1 hypothetical protein EDC32_101839 [Laceyella sacchari]UWE04761.1 hypothetical protein NYR52_06430 [Laceyella sacchari]
MTNPGSKPYWHYLVLAFVLFGAVIEFIQQPSRLLLPALVIGIVIYLYKFPPRWLLRLGSMRSPLASKQAKTHPRKRKKYPFRVIEGNNNKKSL